MSEIKQNILAPSRVKFIPRRPAPEGGPQLCELFRYTVSVVAGRNEVGEDETKIMLEAATMPIDLKLSPALTHAFIDHFAEMIRRMEDDYYRPDPNPPKDGGLLVP